MPSFRPIGVKLSPRTHQLLMGSTGARCSCWDRGVSSERFANQNEDLLQGETTSKPLQEKRGRAVTELPANPGLPLLAVSNGFLGKRRNWCCASVFSWSRTAHRSRNCSCLHRCKTALVTEGAPLLAPHRGRNETRSPVWRLPCAYTRAAGA